MNGALVHDRDSSGGRRRFPQHAKETAAADRIAQSASVGTPGVPVRFCALLRKNCHVLTKRVFRPFLEGLGFFQVDLFIFQPCAVEAVDGTIGVDVK